MSTPHRRAERRQARLEAEQQQTRRRRNRYQLLSLLLLLIAAVVYFSFDITLVRLAPQAAAYPVGTQAIPCTWRNGMARQVGMGEHYTVERLEGESWVALPFAQGHMVSDVGYSLTPLIGRGGLAYSLATLAQPPGPGRYRIAAPYTLGPAPSLDSYTAYAEFELQ